MYFDLEIVEEINEGPLFIRKIEKSDAEFIFSSLNKREITAYLSLGPLKTYEDSKRLIRKYLKYWDNYAQFNYIIEIKELNITRIGTITLWNLNWRHSRGEIGIWIIPSFWNKGYGKMALNLIKKIGFIHLKLNRLEAHVALENENSVNLFQNCGFKREGILKQYLQFEGKFQDAILLACLKNEMIE